MLQVCFARTDDVYNYRGNVVRCNGLNRLSIRDVFTRDNNI